MKKKGFVLDMLLVIYAIAALFFLFIWFLAPYIEEPAVKIAELELETARLETETARLELEKLTNLRSLISRYTENENKITKTYNIIIDEENINNFCKLKGANRGYISIGVLYYGSCNYGDHINPSWQDFTITEYLNYLEVQQE